MPPVSSQTTFDHHFQLIQRCMPLYTIHTNVRAHGNRHRPDLTQVLLVLQARTAISPWV